jgi:hypothetical protein
MREVEILREMLSIYEKYYKIVASMGTISMSTKDNERLAALKAELETIR